MGMRLIVTADDLGISPQNDMAILESAERGIVTSVSVLAGGPNASASVPLAANLCLGLHLAFVDATPLSQASLIPSLVSRSGRFHAKVWVLARKRVVVSELWREAEAQYRRFVALAGRQPTFINTHQHTQLLPDVLRVVRGLCSRYAIRHIRNPTEQTPVRIPRRVRSILWPAATALAVAGARHLRADGLSFPDRMIGGPDSGALTVGRLTRLIDSLRAGTTELVVHPGATPRELDALTDPRIV
ncbi:MAG: putative glycoside hydrolase/deacetylase ChbG (UPF0249 family), partial [Myxococcota bacterium]